jgi:hypothetical protein
MLIPNSKKALLIDGTGAIISAISLGMISKFQPHFGMPVLELRILIYCACCFAIYSLSAYFLGDKKWRNLLYCVVSIIFLGINASRLTTLGWLYFIPEVIIVGGLAILELKIAYLFAQK